MSDFVDSSQISGVRQTAVAGDVINVILEGGPPSFPVELRFCQMPGSEVKVKVPYLGGYEHFERDPGGGPEDPPAVVFRWTGRTRVAE